MYITYAHCNHCDSEYNELIWLGYFASNGLDGCQLKCIDCGRGIHNYIEADVEEYPKIEFMSKFYKHSKE